MDKKRFHLRLGFLILVLFLAVLNLASFPDKVKVIVDNAELKDSPDSEARTLATIPLNVVLEASEKSGAWYTVSFVNQGVAISGYIHQNQVALFVEEPGELQPEETPGGQPSQEEIIAEVEKSLEQSRSQVREERELEGAIDSLDALLAKLFRVTDGKKQRELAVEIYLWAGIARAARSDEQGALKEFSKMYEVDQAYAKDVTKYIFAPKVVALIERAEKKFLGLVIEYSLAISTVPEGAKISINGVEIGLSPELYRTTDPQFRIEIEKEGYKPVREQVSLTDAINNKEYILEKIGTDLTVDSVPSGAYVLLDGVDTGKLTPCVLEMVPFGRYTVKLVKENYLDWERSVEVSETNGSPSVEARLVGKNYMFLRKWGDRGAPPFRNPSAIAVDREGSFYVVDESDMKLKKFSPDGQLISDWGFGGAGFKDLRNPAGVAVDNQGNIYITDFRRHMIIKLDNSGQFVGQWGKEGSGELNLKSPMGITVDSQGDVYVADSGNHRIKKYSAMGRPLLIWGTEGDSDGSFISPKAVTVSQAGTVFVLDKKGVQAFTSDGEFIRFWGKSGTAEGEFLESFGIAVDTQNYVYLADSLNHRVQKFSERGEFVSSWGSIGAGEGQMNLPLGVAVDSRGYVFVVERDNNRVQAFFVGSR